MDTNRKLSLEMTCCEKLRALWREQVGKKDVKEKLNVLTNQQWKWLKEAQVDEKILKMKI